MVNPAPPPRTDAVWNGQVWVPNAFFAPDGYLWDGVQWSPRGQQRPKPPTAWSLHWLVPVAMVMLGFLSLSRANEDKGLFGLATDQSIGDVVIGYCLWAAALGYCLGRFLAFMQARNGG